MKTLLNSSAPFFVCGWLALSLVGPRDAVAGESLKLEVRETAGIRRFGYPIALTLPELSAATDNVRFRLRDGHKPLAAQLRKEEAADGGGPWWLDFNVNLMPGEVRMLTLEYGPDVAADPEPRGLELKQTADGIEIRNGSHLTWTLGREPAALVKSVDAAGLQHVRPEGVRLFVEDEGGGLQSELRDAAHVPRIVRSGPLAVAVRYEFAPATGPLAGTKSTVDVTLPVSKSWIQVDWRIDDPRQALRSARAEIAQNLDSPSDKEPTLVDFGASSLVYMALSPGTAGALRASNAATEPPMPMGRVWQVLRGPRDRLEPFAVRPSATRGGDAEGWAHVMDRSRCLALAVGEFGGGGDDLIGVTAEGTVTIARRFAAGAGRAAAKHFRFWLHFVGFPPHVTAATSPQSMLSPLAVRVGRL